MMDSHQQPSRLRQRDSRKKQILSPYLTTDHRRIPKRQFGKSKLVFRSFQVAWFDIWRWMHYVEDEDKLICNTCTRAHITHQLAMLDAGMQPPSPKAIQTGRMPRERRQVFSHYEKSQCHREAVERSITLHVMTNNAGEHISSSREQDNANNRSKGYSEKFN